MDSEPTCTGDCCRAFSLGQHSIEQLREACIRNGVPDVAEMIIDLGLWTRNPTGRLPDGSEPPRKLNEEPRSTARFHGGRFLTCTHHCGETGLCNIYEDRPKMCRVYPNYSPCVFEGCEVNNASQLLLGELASLREDGRQLTQQEAQDLTLRIVEAEGRTMSGWERQQIWDMTDESKNLVVECSKKLVVGDR